MYWTFFITGFTSENLRNATQLKTNQPVLVAGSSHLLGPLALHPDTQGALHHQAETHEGLIY